MSYMPSYLAFRTSKWKLKKMNKIETKAHIQVNKWLNFEIIPFNVWFHTRDNHRITELTGKFGQINLGRDTFPQTRLLKDSVPPQGESPKTSGWHMLHCLKMNCKTKTFPHYCFIKWLLKCIRHIIISCWLCGFSFYTSKPYTNLQFKQTEARWKLEVFLSWFS